MDIKELPIDVANKLQNCLNSRQKIDVIPSGTISCLKKWFKNYAWVLADYYEDWIVADLNSIAQYSFDDNELKNFVDFDLNDSSEMNNALRIKHMRSYLLPEEIDVDSGDYPSPMIIEAKIQNKKVVLGVVNFLDGQVGWRSELFGIFRSRKEFSQALLKRGYVEVFPLDASKSFSDKALLRFWNK